MAGAPYAQYWHPTWFGRHGVYGVGGEGGRESEREVRERGERETRGYEPFALHAAIH